MSDSVLTIRYEISIKIPIADNYETKDVNAFYVYRLPIQKAASFGLISFPMPMIPYKQIKQKIKEAELYTDYPVLKMDINITDDSWVESRNTENKKLIVKKTYRILKIFSEEEEKVKSNMPVVKLYLVNEVLWYLNNTNSFNTIGEELTAMDFIKQFEGFLKSTYTNYFEFKKLIKNENSYNYEQILARTNSDIQIPIHLIHTFKATNSFSYYFFDDFKLDGTVKKDILGLMVTLTDKEIFKKIDTFDKKYKDFAKSFKQVHSILIKDLFQEYNKDNPIINLRDKDYIFKKIDTPTTSKTPKSIDSSNQETLLQGRKIGSHLFENAQETKQPTRHLEIYCPDSFDNGQSRFENLKSDINTNFDTIEFFELHDCHIDLIQFDRIYNIVYDTRDQFVFLPISIVNIFRKEEQRQQWCRHTAKFQCLKFKSG